MLTQDALAQFLAQLEADGRSPHTMAQYRRHVRLLAQWASDGAHSGHVEDFSREDVTSFLTATVATRASDGRQKRPTSVNAVRTSVRCFFAYTAEVGLTATNPAARLRRAHCSPPPPRGVTDDDLQRLLDAIEKDRSSAARRDLALVRTLSESGLRLGSAIGLNVEDLDLESREAMVRQAKGHHRQIAVLPKVLCDHLREHLGDRTSGPLFATGSGKRISTRQAQRRLAYWADKAGTRPLSAHSFRHGFAMRLYRKTGDIHLVQQALGHRSIVSTLVYARSDRSRLAEAI